MSSYQYVNSLPSCVYEQRVASAPDAATVTSPADYYSQQAYSSCYGPTISASNPSSAAAYAGYLGQNGSADHHNPLSHHLNTYPQSYYNPAHHLGQHVSTYQPPIHRSPSPRPPALVDPLADPPSPPERPDSGSDSEQGANPVIYPWMKKVHVNQGEYSAKGFPRICRSQETRCPSGQNIPTSHSPFSLSSYTYLSVSLSSFPCCLINSRKWLYWDGTEASKDGVHSSPDPRVRERIPLQSLLNQETAD